jgi:hypothetical protein
MNETVTELKLEGVVTRGYFPLTAEPLTWPLVT